MPLSLSHYSLRGTGSAVPLAVALAVTRRPGSRGPGGAGSRVPPPSPSPPAVTRARSHRQSRQLDVQHRRPTRSRRHCRSTHRRHSRRTGMSWYTVTLSLAIAWMATTAGGSLTLMAASARRIAKCIRIKRWVIATQVAYFAHFRKYLALDGKPKVALAVRPVGEYMAPR